MSRAKNSHLDPAIRRGRIEELTIFEISEAELDALERGSPESLFLNFALFAISAAMSFSATLLTTEIQSVRTFCVFVIITVIGYTTFAVFGILWYRASGSVKAVAKQIRSRVAPEGIQLDSPTA